MFGLVRNNLVLDVQAFAESETREVGGYPVTFSDYHILHRVAGQDGQEVARCLWRVCAVNTGHNHQVHVAENRPRTG